MGGAIIILVALFVVVPIGVFAVGLIWSALSGWLLVADADDRATPAPEESAPAS
jgi:hypothetical protein